MKGSRMKPQSKSNTETVVSINSALQQYLVESARALSEDQTGRPIRINTAKQPTLAHPLSIIVQSDTRVIETVARFELNESGAAYNWRSDKDVALENLEYPLRMRIDDSRGEIVVGIIRSTSVKVERRFIPQ